MRGAAVCGIATMRKSVAVRHSKSFSWLGAAGKVAALVYGVAPSAIGIPVPGGDSEFGVLAVGDGSPSSGERRFDSFRSEDLFELFCGEYVERAAQRLIGVEGDGLGGRNIDAHGLCRRNSREKEKHE